MIDEIILVALVPLLFGAFETNSFQSTFCNIEIFGVDLIECDELRDTLTIVPGQNVNMTVNNATDTITLDVPAINTITVQTTPLAYPITDVTFSQVYFVSDGSIIFNVTTTYP
jgi:hypothetical protein